MTQPTPPAIPPLPPKKSAFASQADEALRRVIGAPATVAPKLPTEPAARRRAIQTLRW